MKLTVGTKLLVGFLAVIAFLLILGTMAYFSVGTLSDAANKQAEVANDIARIGDLRVEIKSLQELPHDYLASGHTDIRAEFAETRTQTLRLLKEHLAEASDQAEKAAWSQVEKDLGPLIDAGAAALALEDPIGNPKGPDLIERIDYAVQRIEKSVAAAQELVDNESKKARAEMTSLERRTKVAILTASLMATGLAIGIALYLGLGISRSLRQTAALARRLSSGDLTVEQLQIKTRDEVGELAGAFNQMVKHLRRLIRQVTDSAQTVSGSAGGLNSAAEQVAQSSQGVAQAVSQVAQGASAQSQSVGQTAQVVEQLRSTIAQIAAGAQEQARNAGQTSAVVGQMARAIEDVTSKARNVLTSSQAATGNARDGVRVVEQTVDGMSRIRSSVLESAGRIRELGQLSAQIGEITQVITEIADQTNLLALNAAIEAARAGEHGKGFAVVAEEVRKLAERSSKSAKEIASLIRSIQDGTNQAVKAMEQGTLEVEEGSRLAVDAGRALREILGSVEQAMNDVGSITAGAEQIAESSREVVWSVDSVAAITKENTAATKQMAASSDQVSRSIDSIASISEENAAAAEEVSASIEEMNASTEEIATLAKNLTKIAQELQTQVGVFKI